MPLNNYTNTKFYEDNIVSKQRKQVTKKNSRTVPVASTFQWPHRVYQFASPQNLSQ